MKMRIAKKILGLRKAIPRMFSGGRRGHGGWRLYSYSWKQLCDAHWLILRKERRYGFPSKWS